MHIAEAVGREAKAQGYSRLAITGTKSLMIGRVYPERLREFGMRCEVPVEGDRERIDRIIFEALACGTFAEKSRLYFNEVMQGFKDRGCDAVVQLLMHRTTACGVCSKRVVAGMREDPSAEEMPPDEMLLPVEAMPSIESVAQAREMLASDRELALEIVEEVGEEDLAGKEVSVPWNPAECFAVGRHLLQMVEHLMQHKGQHFYYLKLMGKPVNSGHLWGM